MAEPFHSIDVSEWNRAHSETLGTKPKRWLREPETDVLWLMKDVTHNTNKDGSRYQKGDDWAERIAAAVAESLELPSAQVELAYDRGTGDGVISRSIIGPSETLVLGNELLAGAGFGGTNPRDRAGYTIATVREVLSKVEPPDAAAGLTAWENFVGFLVLDALVGNSDRHQENWAVIAVGGLRRLAPSFDHASCLGFLLSDQRRSERLVTRDENQTPERFADSARTKFENRDSPVATAIAALEGLPAHARNHWLARCDDVDAIVRSVALVPENRISEPAREFAERVLRRNQSRIVSHPFATV